MPRGHLKRVWEKGNRLHEQSKTSDAPLSETCMAQRKTKGCSLGEPELAWKLSWTSTYSLCTFYDVSWRCLGDKSRNMSKTQFHANWLDWSCSISRNVLKCWLHFFVAALVVDWLERAKNLGNSMQSWESMTSSKTCPSWGGERAKGLFRGKCFRPSPSNILAKASATPADAADATFRDGKSSESHESGTTH